MDRGEGALRRLRLLQQGTQDDMPHFPLDLPITHIMAMVSRSRHDGNDTVAGCCIYFFNLLGRHGTIGTCQFTLGVRSNIPSSESTYCLYRRVTR